MLRFYQLMDKVLAKESDAEIKEVITLIKAMIGVKSTDPAIGLKAVQDLGESDNPDIKLKLTEMTDPANEAR